MITYLATTHRTPPLLPTDARGRADVDRWLHGQSAHLGPVLSRVAFERFVKPMAGLCAADGAVLSAARRDFARHCAVLEGSLVDAEDGARRLTVADFALACVLNSAELAGLSLREFPRTRAWLQRMLERDSLKRALADARQSLHGMYGPPINGDAAGA